MISLKVLNIFYLNYNLRSAGLQCVTILVRFRRRCAYCTIYTREQVVSRGQERRTNRA